MSCLQLWLGAAARHGGPNITQRRCNPSTHPITATIKTNSPIQQISRLPLGYPTQSRFHSGPSKAQTSWISPRASYATSASKSSRITKSSKDDNGLRKRSTKKKEDRGGWLNIVRPEEEELMERVRKAESPKVENKADLVKSVGSEAYDRKRPVLSEWELPDAVDMRDIMDDSRESDWRGATGASSQRGVWNEESMVGSRGWEGSVSDDRFDDSFPNEMEQLGNRSSFGRPSAISSAGVDMESRHSHGKRQKKIIEFESPLKGDFTDLGASYPAVLGSEEKGIMDTSLGDDSRRGLLEAEKVGLVESSPSKRDLSPAVPLAPLGLDSTSRRILASGSDDVVGDYMRMRDMSEKDIEEAKYSAQLPPGGSLEATAIAARRVADILTMPIHGPSPIYKGRDPTLFTDDEERYFDKFPRTAQNYNKFIWSLSKVGKYDKAKLALEAMKRRNIKRDVGIYTSLMQGCIKLQDPREAIRVFIEMRKDGIAPDLWVFSTLMEVFVVSGELDGAFALYDELKPNGLKPSNIIFTTLIKGCIRDNDLDRAWKVFDHMRVWHCEPDEVLMNLMIHASAVRSEAERAFRLYQDMKTLGLRPTHVTFNSLLHACVRRRDYYEQAFDLLRTMKVEGYIPDHMTFDMLLAVAAKGGDVQTAELLFDEASQANTAPHREQTYAYMIEAYAMSHRVQAEQHNRKLYVTRAEKLFDRMVASGIKPTALSLNMRLNLYTWNSRISDAVAWKKAMREVYHVKPDVYTYTSLIEMYGRTRQMDLALDQFNLMKAEGLEPSLATYGVLMEGCTRSHLVNTGMKLLREMKAKNIDIKPETTFIINFRRGLIKTPDIVREIDQITGKAYRFVMPWRRKGHIRKITYHRELTKEEAKKTSLYG